MQTRTRLTRVFSFRRCLRIEVISSKLGTILFLFIIIIALIYIGILQYSLAYFVLQIFVMVLFKRVKFN